MPEIFELGVLLDFRTVVLSREDLGDGKPVRLSAEERGVKETDLSAPVQKPFQRKGTRRSNTKCALASGTTQGQPAKLSVAPRTHIGNT